MAHSFIPRCQQEMGQIKSPLRRMAAALPTSLSACRLTPSSPRCTQPPMHRGESRALSMPLPSQEPRPPNRVKDNGLRSKAGPSQSFPDVPFHLLGARYHRNTCSSPGHTLTFPTSALRLVSPPRSCPPPPLHTPSKPLSPQEADVRTRLSSGDLPPEVNPGHHCCWSGGKNLGFGVGPGFMSLFCHLPVCGLGPVTSCV